MKKILTVVVIFMIFVGIKVYGFSNSQVKTEDNGEFKICIDPGHQRKANYGMEPIGPGSTNMKQKVTSGTAGVGTKKAEYEVNLEASKLLKSLLMEKGYNVIMTRESHDVNISNSERAIIGNSNNVDLVIRIHCDSINNSSKRGASILIPSKVSKYTSSIYEKSKEFGGLLSQSLKDNNIKVCGVFERDDMTGFNRSKVPVVILGMGFMSNYDEDRMLSDATYQKKLMMATIDAVSKYQAQKNHR